MARFHSHHRARLTVRPLEGRDVPNGTVTAVLSPTGVLTLTGDDDDNVVTLKVTAGDVTLTPDGNTQVNTAAVGNAVTLTGAVKSIKAKLLGGADTLAIDGAANFAVSGPVSISLGDGNNALNLVTTGNITLPGLTYAGGDGTDDVTIDGGTGSTVGGTAKISVANGGGTIALTGVGFSGVTYTGGDAAGAIPNAIVGTNITVAKTFSANLGNSNPATLDFTDSALGGLKASGNSFTSGLTNTTVNTSLTYKALFGAAVFADGLTVTKNLSVTAPNASVFAPPAAPGAGAGLGLVVGGNLTVSGAAATTVSFESDGASSVVKGNITVKGGFGNDDFDTNANFKADKNITLTLNGGDNLVTIGDGSAAVSVGGKGSITAGDGNDQVLFDRVSWTGPITISTKGGADFLSVEDGSTFQATFTADLGNGDDTISMGQNTALDGSPGGDTFVGKAKITAGAGNDAVFLGLAVSAGGDAVSKVTFNDNTSVVDGGLGLDFFDPTSSQFTGAVTPNWE